MPAARVLIIEDEPDIAEIAAYNLQREGFATTTAGDGEIGLELARRTIPELILLDLMLPALDGLELCRLLKQDAATADIPIIMVTAKGKESDVVLGLGLGADDYVIKPFSPRELIARVQAVLRRGPAKGLESAEERLEIEGLVIDRHKHQVTVDGARIKLTAILTRESLVFFDGVAPSEFLLGTRWSPLLSGTLMIVVGSALVAVPIGLGSAIFLSEYAAPEVRKLLKPVLEILAGVPTVVSGYFALTTLTPVLRALLPQTRIFNALSASIVVGIMILPMIASLCDDALRAVPDSLRQAAHALGATRLEVSTQIVVPGALSGILAAFVLAASRAFGETMAVTLAAGATPNLTLNPLESIQTVTAYIVQVSLGDTPAGGIEYQTIFAAGALLFVVTLGMNVLAHRIRNRYRETYE